MTRTRWAVTLGSSLAVVGIVIWVWVVQLASPVDAAALRIYEGPMRDRLGYEELELLVRDLRLAPLTLLVAGAVIMRAARLRAGTTSEPGALSDRGRRLVAITAIGLASSPVALQNFSGFGSPVDEMLPVGYPRSVMALESLLLAASLLALFVAARRLTVWHGAAAVATVSAGVGALNMGDTNSLLAMALASGGYVGLVTSAAVAGEMGRGGNRRAVVAGVITAVTYLPVLFVSLFPAIFLGAPALELNGGGIGVDGLPIYLVGPLSAWMAVVVYLTAVNRWTVLLPKEQRKGPSTNPVTVR